MPCHLSAGRLVSAIAVAIITILLVAAVPADAEDVRIVPVTLEKPPETPAETTLRKMAMQGKIDGQDWSINLSFDKTPLEAVLKRIAEIARAKPYEINMIIDPQALMDAPASFLDMYTVEANGLSLQEALELILPEMTAWQVLPDGKLWFTGIRQTLHATPRRVYDLTDVHEALKWVILPPPEVVESRFSHGSSIFDGQSMSSEDSPLTDLRMIIEARVTPITAWDTRGGDSTLSFSFGGRLMTVRTDENAQRQTMQLLRELLRLAEQTKQMHRRRLSQAEEQLKLTIEEAGRIKARLRELYIIAGRDDFRLTRQSIMAEAARAEPGKLDVARLLQLADQIEETKAELAVFQQRIDARRKQIHALWEQLNGIEKGSRQTSSDESPYDDSDSVADAPPAAPLSEDALAVAAGGNAFALDLYARLRDGEGNIFYSPYSISAALAMSWGGARAETQEQMAKVLHFDLPQAELHQAQGELLGAFTGTAQPGKRKFQLSIANRLWGREGVDFEPDFLALTADCYRSELQMLAFATEDSREVARLIINADVEKNTQGRIKDLIQQGSLTADTSLVLTNAIFFKGSWATKFERNATKDAPFTTSGGKQAKVPMMLKLEKTNYLRGDGFQAVSMDYLGGELAMVILLPDKADGLPQLEKSLTAEKLRQWQAAMAVQAMEIYLPRFKMTQSLKLSKELRAMGMNRAFVESEADFSGITKNRPLFISEVLHKAFVEVNEEGTEAAAATAVIITEGTVEETVTFRADHPFVFLIQHKASGALLFVGRVSDPKATQE